MLGLLPLQEKYILLASPLLSNFKKKRDNLYNVRCPVCGDSSNRAKARGYFYVSKHRNYRYMCHNCGCNISIKHFLEKVSPQIHSEYQLEYLKELNGHKPQTKAITPQSPFSYKAFSKDQTTAKPKELVGIQTINTLPVFHKAYTYLKHERSIPVTKLDRLYYVKNLQSFVFDLYHKHGHTIADIESKYPDDERILIPTVDRDNRLVGLSCRAVGEVNDRTMRYITVKLIEDSPNIFGLDRVDFSKTVYCCEGQLDSLYLPNAIAVSGSGLHAVENAFSPSEHGVDVVYIHDNQPRNREIVREVKRTIDSGASVVVWEPNSHFRVGKDIGSMVEYGTPLDTLLWEIQKRTFKGIKAKLEFNRWAKVGV